MELEETSEEMSEEMLEETSEEMTGKLYFCSVKKLSNLNVSLRSGDSGQIPFKRRFAF